MALAVNSEMASNVGFGADGDPATPQTFSFTNTSGTLLVLIIGLAVGGGETAPTFNTVSYGGQTMTSLLERTTSGGATGSKIGLFYLLSPPTGSNTVSIAWTANSGDLVMTAWAGCTSFTGNHATPFAQSTSASGSSATASGSLTGCTAGNMTICGAGAGSSISSNTQTLTWVNNVSESSSMGCGRASRAASSGTVTHSFTISASDSWATVIAEIAAASGAQTIAVGQASETDTVPDVLVRVKALAAAQTSETNTSQAMTRLKTLAAAQTSEEDTATAIARYSNVPRLRVVRSNLINI